MTAPHFDLVSEPWIPVTFLDGSPREVGIREALVEAENLRGLGDDSPLVTVTLHRLLIAVLHRVFGPGNRQEWTNLWNAKAFPRKRVEDYLSQWRSRFDLFHPTHPFFQCSSLEEEKRTSVAALQFDLVSGNNPTLFDHSLDDEPHMLAPAAAARQLIAFQGFATGGLISYQTNESPAECKSAKAAPLVKGALVLVFGDTLFETLMLNLVRYDPTNEMPFRCDPEGDKPIWERERAIGFDERRPVGYLDFLTLPSRRVRLLPEVTPSGLAVRHVVRMKGEWFPSEGRVRYETMVRFRPREKAKPGEDPFFPVGFREGEAFWRDCSALFQHAEGDEGLKTFRWLRQLATGPLAGRRFRLGVFGHTSDQALILFWRREELPLPIQYLQDNELCSKLEGALHDTRQIGQVLYKTLQYLARLLLVRGGDRTQRDPDKNSVALLAKSLDGETMFWAALESPFGNLVVELAETNGLQAAELDDRRTAQVAKWRERAKREARTSLGRVTNSLDGSATNLKSAVLAETRLTRDLSIIEK